MFNLFYKSDNIKKVNIVLSSVMVILILGISGFTFYNYGEFFIANILASLCLCIAMYLNHYIFSGFRFDKTFSDNIHGFLNLLGILFCCCSLFFFLIELRPLNEIFLITGFLHIVASLFLNIKRAF